MLPLLCSRAGASAEQGALPYTQYSASREVTSVKAELARRHSTTVLWTTGKWKKLYFAFFINSELSIAFIFPQVKRTSGVQGIVV